MTPPIAGLADNQNEHMAKLRSAFDALFNPRPYTDADAREHARLVARQRARDEARLREPDQGALPLA